MCSHFIHNKKTVDPSTLIYFYIVLGYLLTVSDVGVALSKCKRTENGYSSVFGMMQIFKKIKDLPVSFFSPSMMLLEIISDGNWPKDKN